MRPADYSSGDGLQHHRTRSAAPKPTVGSIEQTLSAAQGKPAQPQAGQQPPPAEAFAGDADELSRLLASTRVGLLYLDEQLRVRRFTPEAAHVFRLRPQDIGRCVNTLEHGLAYPDLVRDLQQVLETRQEKELEANSTQGGYYLLRMTPYFSGGQSGLAVALFDIKILRRAEHGLILQDRAIDAASVGIVIADAAAGDLPIVYANAGFEKLTGHSRKAAIGMSCGFLQGPATDPRAIADIRKAIEQRQACRLTLLSYKKNGQTFWNDLHISPIYDDRGSVTHVVAVHHDVTEFVNTQRAIRESEEQYRSTYENAAVGIAHLDTGGRWVRVNSRLCEILGYTADELLGMTFHQLADPEDVGAEAGQFKALIHGEVDEYSCESRYHHRDGHVVWVLLSMSPRIHTDGTTLGCIAVVQDISARKATELVAQKARRMADSANRAKSSFVANMSHELRTPMTTILGFAEMLADEIEAPEQIQKVQTLKHNGEYLLRLLDEIRDLSKIESHRVRLDTEPCDFIGLVNEVEVLMQGRAGQTGNRLSFEFPTLLPQTIYTSASRVRRILVNLIATALKFASTGQVNVTIRYREDECGDEEEQPCLEFWIAEQTDAATQPIRRSFVSLNQADPAVLQCFTSKSSGLGISKRLVTAMGGTIEVTSDQSSGSKAVRVRLPIGEAGDLELISRSSRPPELQGIPAAAQLQWVNGKILVADDRRDVWRVTKYFLERCGAEVAVAEDGRQAVEAVTAAAAAGEPFDLLLLDLQMPVMGGLEAVRELRGSGFSLPIIALTADAMKGERQRCLAAGCNDYLTKPIDVALLTQTVVKYLGDAA